MAINFTRLFTALGKIIASVNSENTYRGTTLPARTAVLDAQYVSPNQALISGLYPAEDAAQAAGDGWMAYLRQLAAVTVIQEVDLDRPMVNPTLPAALASVAAGLRAVTPTPETVTESPTVLSDTPTLTVGDAQLVFAAGVNPSDLYNPDVYLLNVVSDQTTGSTAYSEFISVVGKANVAPLNWLWPTGSGVNSGITATNSANDTLVSPDFSTWTASGTVVIADTVPGPRGETTATKLSNDNTYVQYELPVIAPGTYSWTVFIQGDGANSALSTVEIQIVNAAGTTVATLDSVDATVSTWEQYSGVWNFTTQPPVAPSTYYLRIRCETSADIDVHVALPGFDSALPLYAGGPVLYVWSGTEPLGLADSWTATVTRATSETVSLYRGMCRLFDLPSLSPQITIPTGSPGTYTNALVA
jgi:hypothetical protein